MSNAPESKKRNYKPLIHIVFWLLFLAAPLIVIKGKDNVDLIHFERHIVLTTTLILLFYLNYAYIVKKYFTKQGLKKFTLTNVLLVGFGIGINYICHNITYEQMQIARQERWEEYFKEMQKESGLRPNTANDPLSIRPKQYRRNNGMNIWDALLNLFAFTCIIGMAMGLRSIQDLYLSEKKKKEEEQAQTEAELRNLKNQLNPHFLFNTLNNIYALIAISQEKSQEAVMELSKMLRYVLYESDSNEVPLSKEITFIENYVNLMRLRLNNKVDLQVTTDISANPNLNIAPLLFISLIENAFKHGISAQSDSFIHFSITVENPTTIGCHLENSYFPKEINDKSGSGIGLENLKRRLELIYPNRHQFEYGIKDNVYFSNLKIQHP